MIGLTPNLVVSFVSHVFARATTVAFD